MKNLLGITAFLFLFGLVGANGAIAEDVDKELIMADGLNCPCKAEVEVPPPPPPPPPPPVAPSVHDFYIGGGYGASMMDGCEGDGECNDPTDSHDNITAHDPGYKFLLGYRLHRFLGLEATFYDLGQGVDDETFPDTYSIYGGSLAGLAFLPIDEKTKLFAKAGGFLGEITEYESDSPIDSNSEDGISLLVGVGGEFQIFENFSIRGEVEWMPNIADGGEADGANPESETADIDVLFTSINLIWHFMGQNTEDPILSPGNDLSSLNGFYFGGGALGASWDGGEEVRGNGNFEDVITDLDVSGKGFIGYRFCRYCAIEVGYSDLGDALDDDGSPAPDSFEAEAVSFALMSILPVSERTSIFAKFGGVYGWLEEFDPHDSPGAEIKKEDGLSLLFGGGINFDLAKNVSLRGELEFMPNFADGRPGPDVGIDDEIGGETADVDIIATSASLIWWFR
ncbi:MAG: outer membrane beta-barrel protein [Nitrospinales bacterium]